MPACLGTQIDGRYHLNLDASSSLYSWLLIEAPGYAPEMQSIGTNRILNFELRKEDGLKGRVVDPNGQAVEGASVAYRLIGSSLWLSTTEFRNRINNAVVTTDRDGNFRELQDVHPSFSLPVWKIV